MIVVGIDEVGRGCWAGPLVAGAVILSKEIPGLKDSKLLSKKRRETLAELITINSNTIGIGWVDAIEIDKIGLTKATALAMQRALDKIKVGYDQIIIDGSLNYLSANPKATALIKADNIVPCVSAASIIAKVARDDYMSAMALEYPNYGFEKHVGYGTKVHLEKLKLYGLSKLHRKSFRPIANLMIDGI